MFLMQLHCIRCAARFAQLPLERNNMYRNLLYSLLILLLSTLACKPVIAISWNEFLIVGILFAVLLGPPIYKFIRRVEEFLRHKSKNQ